jgi:hypothetical protein
MFRALLAATLSLVILLGPSTCCCAAEARPVANGSEQCRTAVNEPVRSCCANKGPAGEQDDQRVPRDESRPCPCRGEQVLTAMRATSAALDRDTSFSRPCNLDLADGGPLVVSDFRDEDQTMRHCGRRSIYPSPRAMLRALHVLRC